MKTILSARQGLLTAAVQGIGRETSPNIVEYQELDIEKTLLGKTSRPQGQGNRI